MQVTASRRALLFTGMLCALLGCDRGVLRPESRLQIELPKMTSEELFQIGVLQARRGDLLRAEQYIVAARAQGYDESSSVYWLVRVCVSAGRFHSALGHAQSYLRRNPSNWRLRLVVASIYEALGDNQRAVRELESVVRGAPHHALPHYRLAVLYGQLGAGHERAARHLHAYLTLSPAGPHAAEARLLLENGRDRMPEQEVAPKSGELVAGSKQP